VVILKNRSLRVDMYYTSTPIWITEKDIIVTEDTEIDSLLYINTDIYDFNFSKELLESLNYYEKIWYKSINDKSTSIQDPNMGAQKNIENYVYNLAVKVKSEIPNNRIVVWDDKTNLNKEII
jgi:hypothetical protein